MRRKGRHKACPYGSVLGEDGKAWGMRRKGRHKACPYGSVLGGWEGVGDATEGQAQGLPLRVCFGRMGRRGVCATQGQAQGLPLRVCFGRMGRVRNATQGQAQACLYGSVLGGWEGAGVVRRKGRHKACPYGDLVGLVGVVWRNSFDWVHVTNVDTRFGEACCRRGGVAGAEPPHKGGPNRPDRPELQGSGDRDGASCASE